MQSARLLAVVIGVSAVLIGTSAGALAQTPPPSEEPDARAVIEAAVRAYSAAFLAGEVKTAYAALSEDCQDELSRRAFRRIVRPVAKRYGDAELTTFKITKYSDERARVTYRYDKKVLDVKKEPWVNEDGAWRRDC